MILKSQNCFPKYGMSRKRSRQEFETHGNEDNERMIDDALKEIYDKDEVSEPTKKKVRMQLQMKLKVSKAFIKQNKKLINTLIQKYWISPPKMTNNGDENTDNSIILSIPDHIQQHFIMMLHPKDIYSSVVSVCKWWHHLLHKESFLYSVCANRLQLSPHQIPSSLILKNIIPFLKKCCLNCWNMNTFAEQYGSDPDGRATICWEYPKEICNNCFDSHSELQGISWMAARRKYKLSDYDLYCCVSKKIGKTYLKHSDVMEVAANKYGDITRIHTLSSLEIAAVNSQRKRCYNKKCKELKKELEKWIFAQEEKCAADDTEDTDRIILDRSVLKLELKECMDKYHGGYDFFAGAHCQPIVDNFDRTLMHLKKDMSEIKNIVTEHIRKVKERKREIKNMSKQDVFNDIYASSWMDGRFGGSFDF